MSTVQDIGTKLHDKLRADDIIVISTDAVKKRIRALDTTIDELHAELAAHGWDYTDPLFIHTKSLTKTTHSLADDLREADQLIITETEVINRLTDALTTTDDPNWTNNHAISTIRTAFEDAGWEILDADHEVENGFGPRTFYFIPMHELTNIAATLAHELLDDEIVVIPRHEVNRRVKAKSGFDHIDHQKIRTGFEEHDWTYTRHVYVHKPSLRKQATNYSRRLKSSNSLLVTETEILDELAKPIARGSQSGWEQGIVITTIREAFEDNGWETRTITKQLDTGTASRTMYFRPLYPIIKASHPNGRYPFSPQELCSYYLGESLELMATDN